MNITQTLSAEFGMKETHAENIIALLDEGCTIPFISRYTPLFTEVRYERIRF